MLSFSQSVSHTLADKFTHQTCEIPCEMVVTFTQYSYVFHMIISHACEILQCEWHEKNVNDVKKLPFHTVFHMVREQR